jgi:hypothetical protein
MRRIIILIFLIPYVVSQAQVPEGFPAIDKSDIPGAKFQSPRHFTGESLFGYMDGGAELYREYGITDAVITEFDLKEGHYKCEVFKMTGPEEAFGIYSVSKYRCLSSPPFSPFACQTRYQLQICKGSYYISIINKSGSSTDSLVSLKAGEILARRINDPSADLSVFIPDINTSDLDQTAVLAKGKLGLMNGATDWEDFFKDITGYYTLIYPAKEKSILSVRFRAEEDFQQFVKFHGWNLCDIGVSDVRVAGGVTLRLIGENHLLISVPRQ